VVSSIDEEEIDVEEEVKERGVYLIILYYFYSYSINQLVVV